MKEKEEALIRGGQDQVLVHILSSYNGLAFNKN